LPNSIYLAGPLGFAEVGRNFQYRILIPKLQRIGYQVIDPWKLTDEAKIEHVLKLPYGRRKRSAWKALNVEIGRNNQEGLDKCDLVLAILDGTDVDSGTAAEIGYAFARGKIIFGYRGDFRLASDNEGSLVNLQVEYFIHKSGGEILKTLSDLQKTLKRYGKGLHCG